MKHITLAALFLLTACDLRPHEYAPSPWTTVAFDQAKAQCSAQISRDTDRSDNVGAGFGAILDMGPRVSRCLNGYGYVVVK